MPVLSRDNGRSLGSEVMEEGKQYVAEECRLTSVFGRKFECLKAAFHVRYVMCKTQFASVREYCLCPLQGPVG